MQTKWEGDLYVPFFLYSIFLEMITQDFITKYLQQIEDLDFYIVEVKVSPNMKIAVYIDSFEGIKVGDLSKVHKSIYSAVESKIEKFDLEVSSPGLTSLLKVWQQYKKLNGKIIQIVTNEDEIFDGRVQNADEVKVEIIQKNKDVLSFEYSKIRKAKQIINI